MEEGYYALYQGDKYVMSGTKKEIAEAMNTSINNVDYWHTPAYRKKCKNEYSNRKILITIDNVDNKEKFDENQCKTCFGYSEHCGCRVLTEPIEKKKCPFYKSKEQYWALTKDMR